jgi:acetylornithine/succinyldiaminopimelate/putrescine aminotransferase
VRYGAARAKGTDHRTSEPPIHRLDEIRTTTGPAATTGLSQDRIRSLLATFPELDPLLDRALALHRELRAQEAQALALDEPTLCRRLQDGVLNFYPEDGRSPYVPLAAAGPWVVTLHGALLYDAGGYGMLGLGHAPAELLPPMAEPHMMANVMTSSFAQARLVAALRREIGHTCGGCPFERFAFLNSGSEAMSFSMRLSDVNAERQTEPGTPLRVVSLREGFHGRTYRPARLSHSTRGAYEETLASFRQAHDLLAIDPDDVSSLERAFAGARDAGAFIEAVVLEPVLGEGMAGHPLSRAVYDAARELTRATGALLVVDSIQAGLRAHGCLSIIDYPDFQDCEPPDIETWSKAINAGQFPLSVIAVSAAAADLYVPGIYGNTMTGNPRAMEVGTAVLAAVTAEVRANVRDRGAELLGGLQALADRHPDVVRDTAGTGLMACQELDPERVPVTGHDGLEQEVRRRGLIAIHAGTNGMRFTPRLALTSTEVQLMLDVYGEVLQAALT